MESSQRHHMPEVLLAREMTRPQLRAGVREGLLHRIRPGAYLHDASPETGWAGRRQMELARCVAVVRQCRGEVVLSHRSAALLHDAWLQGASERVDAYLPYVSPRTAPDVRSHHASDLAAEDVVSVQGLPVTSLERTVLDCSRTFGPRAGLAVADSLLRLAVGPDRRRRAESLREADVIRRRWRQRLESLIGRRGVVRARAVLEHAEALCESGGESELRWVVLSRGLPRPMAQVPITTAEGTFFGDLGWPSTRGPLVVAEYDGALKYDSGEMHTLYREKRREDAIRATGAKVLRFTAADLRAPRVIATRLRAALPERLLRETRTVRGLMATG